MNDESGSRKSKTAPLDRSKLLAHLDSNETFIVRGGANRVKRSTEEIARANADALVHDPTSVALVVRGIQESVHLSDERTEVILGRADHSGSNHPDVDLTHLGAVERGVSRRHARLELKGGLLYIVDLNSSNGTFLRGQRLNPYTPTLLRTEDEVLLGRLAVQIVFQ